MTATLTAVFENGVLRPTAPPDIPDGATVRLLVLPDAPVTDTPPPTVRDVLSRRYASGHTDTAARHDEHQP